MKRTTKVTRKRVTKRDLFAELIDGLEAVADARQGNRTLRTHLIDSNQPPDTASTIDMSSGSRPVYNVDLEQPHDERD